jgi:hypothetical protein
VHGIVEDVITVGVSSPCNSKVHSDIVFTVFDSTVLTVSAKVGTANAKQNI